MGKCKWEKDDFCVNADCEHCADFCDHYENQQECKCYEASVSEDKQTTNEGTSAVGRLCETTAKPNTTDAVFIYWQ